MSELYLPIETPRARGAWTRQLQLFVVLTLCLLAAGLAAAEEPIGIFDSHTDVGTVLHPGSATYDPVKHSYTLTGSGENMWATADAFQFAETSPRVQTDEWPGRRPERVAVE